MMSVTDEVFLIFSLVILWSVCVPLCLKGLRVTVSILSWALISPLPFSLHQFSSGLIQLLPNT